MADSELPIVLYHYPYSPYARRVTWYLALRGISYSQCLQPPMLPRPDVARLGIKYRRIPLMAVGRDVYLDTRLILRKLEAAHPSRPRLGADGSSAEARALERLLESLAVDGGLFARAAQLIPPELPLMKDPKFARDRADLNNGRPFVAPGARPEALVEIRNAVEFLETGLLADGRDWILKTERPTLADIEAIWPFHWLTTMPGALPPDQVSARQFPRVFAWIDRFNQALNTAKAALPKPQTLSGEDALRTIVDAPYNEPEGLVDGADTVVSADGLKKGQMVVVWPTDSGSAHKDAGRLVSMNSKEVVLEMDAATSTVRVHAPRHGFRVRPDSGREPKL